MPYAIFKDARIVVSYPQSILERYIEKELNKVGFPLSPAIITNTGSPTLIERKTIKPNKNNHYMTYNIAFEDGREMYDFNGNLMIEDLIEKLSIISNPQQKEMYLSECFGFRYKEENVIEGDTNLEYVITRTTQGKYDVERMDETFIPDRIAKRIEKHLNEDRKNLDCLDVRELVDISIKAFSNGRYKFIDDNPSIIRI